MFNRAQEKRNTYQLHRIDMLKESLQHASSYAEWKEIGWCFKKYAETKQVEF